MDQQKRIFAYFYPQAYINDYAVDIDGLQVVDVTTEVLFMPLDRIKRLRDNRNNTDELVAHCHMGPFRVEAVDSILGFFDVLCLGEITAEMLEDAQKQFTARLSHLSGCATESTSSAGTQHKTEKNNYIIELSGSGWSIRIEGNAITSNLKSGEAEYDAVIDGIESLVLAQYKAGLPVTSKVYLDALNTALDACSNNG